MTMLLTNTETPLFWATLDERANGTVMAVASVANAWPGTICGQEHSPTEALAWHHETVNWEVRSIHYFCGGCVQCMGEGGVGEEPTHTLDCKDPYGPAAWCDCNNLTREDAGWDDWCGCDWPGCTGCMF